MAKSKSIELRNMTSTEIFRLQVESIYGKIRHDNTDDPNITFSPTQLGGSPGQREILIGDNVMRQITVRN